MLNHSSKYAELTDEQFLIIGKIVVEFSNMEFLLGVVASRLLITPEFLGRSYTDKLSASALQDVIINALDIHRRRYDFKIISSAQVDDIKKAIQRITQIRVLRNAFAHYCWTRQTDTEIFGTKLSGAIPKESNPDKDSKIISNEELNKIYNEAYSIVEHLTKLIQELPELKEDIEILKKLKFKNKNFNA
ncbi:hypothetical protein I2I11_03705 [Pontibacter sp. 172403-2]|uniref:hypothetical protein n=1 Tax=Pontibacter rufus TaxID=2791028 RepID=UPI0018AFFD5F|nr:hypothetical protein [Pontibacter sp. 172403-2]MBF9252389.1 hypothetical protein [Pontibacter sp. 172403-2]